MSTDFLAIATSIMLGILGTALIFLLVMLNKNVAALAQALAQLRGDLAPLVGDLRDGIGCVKNLAGAAGRFGEDFEAGRRAVKGSLELLAAPWKDKLGILGRIFLMRGSSRG